MKSKKIKLSRCRYLVESWSEETAPVTDKDEETIAIEQVLVSPASPTIKVQEVTGSPTPPL